MSPAGSEIDDEALARLVSGAVVAQAAGAQEERRLLRRLAAVANDLAAAGLKIGAVKLADAIVGKPGPLPDRMGAGLVADEVHGNVESQPIAAVAVVGDAHRNLIRRRIGLLVELG